MAALCNCSWMNVWLAKFAQEQVQDCAPVLFVISEMIPDSVSGERLFLFDCHLWTFQIKIQIPIGASVQDFLQ